jgi:hypothetical protein
VVTTRDDLIAQLAAIERHLDSRVQVYRVLVRGDGTPTGKRIYVGSFKAPADWQPPSLEDQLAHMKKEGTE